MIDLSKKYRMRSEERELLSIHYSKEARSIIAVYKFRGGVVSCILNEHGRQDCMVETDVDLIEIPEYIWINYYPNGDINFAHIYRTEKEALEVRGDGGKTIKAEV